MADHVRGAASIRGDLPEAAAQWPCHAEVRRRLDSLPRGCGEWAGVGLLSGSSGQLREVLRAEAVDPSSSRVCCAVAVKHDGHFTSILLFSISAAPGNSTSSCQLLDA